MLHTRGAVAGAVLVALALAACSDEAPVGHVGVNLVSEAADGSRYRLPADSYLMLEGDGFVDQLDLGGDAESITVQLPPGDYLATLGHPEGYDREWPLTHELTDGTQEEVLAALTSPQPMSFSISEGATTGLVLRFQVPEVGTITFAQGDLVVTVVVDGTGAESVAVSWTANLAVDGVTTYDAIPPALAALLPASGDAIAVDLRARVTGAWTQTGINQACAPAEYTVEGQSGAEPLTAVVTEALTSASELCVVTEAGTSRLTATFVTAHEPTTAPLAGADPDADLQLILFFLDADLGEVVFEGGVLDLAALTGARTPATSALFRVDGLPNSGGPRERWFRVGAGGTSALAVSAAATPPDTTGPTVTFVATPPVLTNSRSAHFEFVSNEPDTTFYCGLDGLPAVECFSGDTLTNVADGPHTLAVHGRDAAGNEGPPTYYGWTVDTVAPVIDIFGPGSPTTSTVAELEAFTNEEATLQCRLDGDALAPCSGRQTYSVALGSHRFEVRATDPAGNLAVAFHDWVVVAP